MADGNPRSTAQIAGHPIHPMLVPFPIAFLVATLACVFNGWKGWELIYKHRVGIADASHASVMFLIRRSPRKSVRPANTASAAITSAAPSRCVVRLLRSYAFQGGDLRVRLFEFVA
jgi:hypothetical protein